MKNIIAFAGSNSKKSINKSLVEYSVSNLKSSKAEILDLNDYELPIFSVDMEAKEGIPEAAKIFSNKIEASDGIILSLAEHNGNVAAVLKNLTDWISRIGGKTFKDKPMLLMATSPGGRGGATVLDIGKMIYPYAGADIIAEFSLPSFFDNFQEGKISNPVLDDQLKIAIKKLEDRL